MEVGKLTVQQRSKTGKGNSRRTRRAGDVPGVCYGPGLESPISLTVNTKELKSSLDPKKRRNTVLDLTIENEGSAPITVSAMVWDYQFNPIRQEITHVDLMSIDTNKKIDAIVPVQATGKFVGLIKGGILSWERHEVNIHAKPSEIPSELFLDISSLDIGDTLHVGDLPLPTGVSLVGEVGLTVVTCVAPKGLKAEMETEAEVEAKEDA